MGGDSLPLLGKYRTLNQVLDMEITAPPPPTHFFFPGLIKHLRSAIGPWYLN